MTDSLERFLQDLRFDLPAGMVERAKATALIEAGARPSTRVRVHDRGAVDTQKQSWAPATVAVLLAIAIVATLLFFAHQRQAVPARLGPHRSTPYMIPSPPSAASGCSSVPRQWASSPPNPAKMLSTTTGWAYGPMRTTDGGAHWLDVSPPSIPGRTNKNDEFFLDATHAWAAETAGMAGKCVENVVVFRTADAGRTWQSAAPIRVRFADPSDVIWTGIANHASWFDFVDPENGWLLLGSGSAPSPDGLWSGAHWRVGDLYRTTDGGLHWTLVAINPGWVPAGCVPAPINELHASAMSFSSPATGWMLTTCGLLVTHDGGATWGKSATPLVPNEAPIFFDALHGVVLAQDARLLVTSDGGSNWSVRPLPGGAIDVDFINPGQGWAMGIGDNSFQCNLPDLGGCNRNFRLYHTSDGGKTWVPGNFTSLGMPGTKFWPPAYFHFVDPDNGFASTGEDPRENGLFRTTDAGRTWTMVDATVEGP